jgi:carboxyl-terminal processing protease
VDVIVLIDSWSASASEIVSGAIQDNDRGMIVGRRSFGKGLLQEPSFFRDGSQIRLTVARYYTPTGRCIQKSYKNGTDAYYHELSDRAESGEMENESTKKMPDSLKFTTPKGKIVYGGGGITPDVFVPIDTTANTDYLFRSIREGLIYRFSLQYTEQNRTKCEQMPGYKQLQAYLQTQNLLNQYVAFAASKGLVANWKEIGISKKVIETQVQAYIIRNFFDDKGFYPVLNQIDETYLKALHIAESSEHLSKK